MILAFAAQILRFYMAQELRGVTLSAKKDPAFVRKERPQRGADSKAVRLGWSFSVWPGFTLAWLLFFGCSPGQVHLSSDADGADKKEDSTGGTNSSDSDGEGANGGEGSSSDDSSDYTPDLPLLPCILTDSCPMDCSSYDSDCESCEKQSDCEGGLPYCDASIGACVECLDSSDCRDRFGPYFGACSAGRCVQCQTDRDCPDDAECDKGWCGSCDSYHDCPDRMDCERGHCIPDFD